MSVSALWLCLTFSANAQVGTVNATNQIRSDEMMVSIYSGKWDLFDGISLKLRDERKQSINRLIGILADKKTADFQRRATIYYLGELRPPEAVDVLATNITLGINQLSSDAIQNIHFYAPGALIEIGNPAIPAMVRNLAESDDDDVRAWSLKVLSRIEGDKDIVQLRLQKALAAEKDSQKQARLQTALKELAK